MIHPHDFISLHLGSKENMEVLF